MSSETRSPSSQRAGRRAAALTVLLLGCAFLTAACGHKKAPKPPPSKIPQRANITAHQRGSEVIIEFLYPTVTISGTPLEGISGIEVWRFGMEVPEFAVELLEEEAARRKEAQDLLDELGLELYETPTQPGAVDAFGNPIPPAEGTAAPPYGAPPASGDPTDPTTTVDPTVPPATETDDAEPGDTETSIATTEPEETADADAGDVETELEDADGEAAGEEEGDDATGEDGDEDGEDDEDGEEGEDDGEPELTEEEELAIRVEAARNLLRSAPTPKSSFIAATTKDFNQGSELVLAVEADDIGSFVVGDQMVLRVPLPPKPQEGPEIGYLFGLKIFALNGKPSDFSNTVALLPEDVPAAPREVTVEAQALGVLLTWAADEEPEGGFRVYRRDAQSRTYGKAVGILPGTVKTWFDRQAIYGARYIYGVTALESTNPVLESEISSEHEVDYQDRFGPATPSGLVAFPEAGRVRLLWTPVADADLAGYRIRRRASTDEEPELLTDELVTRSQYLDETVSSGEEWLYSVVALDQLDNGSTPSIEVQVRVP